MSNDRRDANAGVVTTPGGPAALNGPLTPNGQAFLETVVAMTPECIKIVAPDGRLLHINAAGLRMIEADSWDRVERAPVFDLIAPEHLSAWREQHERICRGESLTWEFDIVGLNGRRRNMETHAVPIDLHDGTVGQLAVTDRRAHV